jgi:hypothetical protein
MMTQIKTHYQETEHPSDLRGYNGSSDHEGYSDIRLKYPLLM